ncbi:unnamed protein product [Peniophora sp. CBMAI 1063]|nr:unnamed protein product [Peniophora sp. CBMAI 1063]
MSANIPTNSQSPSAIHANNLTTHQRLQILFHLVDETVESSHSIEKTRAQLVKILSKLDAKANSARDAATYKDIITERSEVMTMLNQSALDRERNNKSLGEIEHAWQLTFAQAQEEIDEEDLKKAGEYRVVIEKLKFFEVDLYREACSR